MIRPDVLAHAHRILGGTSAAELPVQVVEQDFVSHFLHDDLLVAALVTGAA